MAPVIMFIGGLALLMSGNRLRRTAAASGEATRGPRARVALGVLLIFMSTVGTAGAELTKQQELHRTTIALPQTLLGLDRDDSLLGTRLVKALSMLQDDLQPSDVGAYGEGTPAVIVGAGRGHFDNPEGVLAHAFPKSAIPDTMEIDSGHEVPTGDLGGKARCWSAESFGSGADICGFVSTTSLVIVIDRAAADTAAAARRALAVRQAVVSVDGKQLTPVMLASTAPSPSVHLALPKTVGGWIKLESAQLARPIAEFTAEERAAGLREAHMAAYAVDGRVVIVQTALGRFRNAEVVRRSFAKDLATEATGPVGPAVRVAGGSNATCWTARLDGPAVICLLFDAQAFVAVTVPDSTNVAKSAAIARLFDAAVVRRG